LLLYPLPEHTDEFNDILTKYNLKIDGDEKGAIDKRIDINKA